MPNFVVEAMGSPQLVHAVGGDQATLEYNVYGMLDPFVADLALQQQAAATVLSTDGQTLYASEYRLDSGRTDKGYTGRVKYEPRGVGKQRPRTLEEDETRRSFTIGGKTVHVDKSLQTILCATHNFDIACPDFKGLVGVTQDGVDGADIIIPEFTWEVKKIVPTATITDAWVKTVADLVATVADDTFKTFPKGEVLFTGMTGAERSPVDAELTFKFARQKNTFVTIPGLAWFNPVTLLWEANIPKLGHEYLWVYYLAEKQAAAKRVVKVPKFAFVDRMYEFGDFTILGL